MTMVTEHMTWAALNNDIRPACKNISNTFDPPGKCTCTMNYCPGDIYICIKFTVVQFEFLIFKFF